MQEKLKKKYGQPGARKKFQFSKDKSMQKITKEDLLNSGAHFGHVSSKTDPNFKDFVVSQKNGIDIINLDDTIEGLDKALNFISNIVQRNGEILLALKSMQRMLSSGRLIDVECSTL